MNRRNLLMAGGVGISATSILAAANVLPSVLSGDEGPDLPKGMSIETVSFTGVAKVTKTDSERAFRLLSEHATIAATAETAREKLNMDEEQVDSFVSGTDFEGSYLVAVDHRASPDERLEVDAIERTDTGLRMGVSVNSPENMRESKASIALLVRVTDERAEVPQEIALEVKE